MKRFSGFISVGFLAACGGGGGGSNIQGTSSTTYIPPSRVTLTASASTIYESSNDLITLTATLSRAETETVLVVLETNGTATEGTDYNPIPDITIAPNSTVGIAVFDPVNDI